MNTKNDLIKNNKKNSFLASRAKESLGWRPKPSQGARSKPEYGAVPSSISQYKKACWIENNLVKYSFCALFIGLAGLWWTFMQKCKINKWNHYLCNIVYLSSSFFNLIFIIFLWRDVGTKEIYFRHTRSMQ